MARMTKRARAALRHKHSLGGMISRAITPAAFGVAFLNQITAKDINSFGQQRFQSLPMMEKAKLVTNIVSGRVLNFSPFNTYPSYQFQPSLTYVLNKYTGTGAGLIVLSHILPKGKGRAIARKTGWGLLLGGVIGGALDPNTGGRAAQGGTPARAAATFGQGASAGGRGSNIAGFGGTMSS